MTTEEQVKALKVLDTLYVIGKRMPAAQELYEWGLEELEADMQFKPEPTKHETEAA